MAGNTYFEQVPCLEVTKLNHNPSYINYLGNHSLRNINCLSKSISGRIHTASYSDRNSMEKHHFASCEEISTKQMNNPKRNITKCNAYVCVYMKMDGHIHTHIYIY